MRTEETTANESKRIWRIWQIYGGWHDKISSLNTVRLIKLGARGECGDRN